MIVYTKKLIKGYTSKQWQKDKNLPKEIIKRLPVDLIMIIIILMINIENLI